MDPQRQAGASSLLDGHSVAMSYLSNAEVSTLYRACSAALEDTYKCSIPKIYDQDLWSWISQDASLHTLPLFVRALALEVALSGHAALGFTTKRLLESLVKRECQRLSNASTDAGFEKEALSKLSAFSAIRSNLNREHGWARSDRMTGSLSIA